LPRPRNLSDWDSKMSRELLRELHDLIAKPCEGIRVLINEQNLSDVTAEIDGPSGTPYDGGLFRMKLSLGAEFPSAPPKGFFLTKIFHPNVSKSGEICVNVLKKDWKPELGLRHVLVVIRCLLIEPYPESALNEEAGKLLLEDYDEYAKHARLMTSLHAQPPRRQMPLTTSGANATGSGSNNDAKESGSSPAAKKAKSDQKVLGAAASKVKKSLKRL
jgi:ubiquitin-conjugating enzyme E2 S